MEAKKYSQTRSGALLDGCRDMVLSDMEKALDNFLKNSSIAYHEFAGKSNSGSSQIRFMEAMSIIERNRKQVENTFLREINKSFSGFGQGVSALATSAADAQLGQLSLQTLEDSDVQVAIQNMIDSATVGAGHNIKAIRQRLSVLNNGRALTDKAIPGGPACLANAFHSALDNLAIDHETRMLVYFLFDRAVLRKTHILYEEYNKRLVKAGILPHLIYEVRKNPVKADQPAERPSRSAITDQNEAPSRKDGKSSTPDEMLREILGLLMKREQQLPETENPSGQVTADPLPQDELISALSNLQRNVRSVPPGRNEISSAISGFNQQDQLIYNLVSQLAADRQQLFSWLDQHRLPSADLQLIDLVGMMFEYMLRDENIPSIAKAELSRLHTSYLKVAVMDSTLFTNNAHPAHALLNTMAEAAAKWVFPNNPERGIYPCLCHIVQRIIDDFDNNLAIFDELLEFITNSVHNLEDRAAAIEQRSRQAADGKEKLEIARDCAARAIETRVTGHNVPDSLRKLLGDIWLDKLMFIYLREPESDRSPSWKLALQAIESIVWSVEPRDSEKARSELRECLPDLQQQLAATLETLSVYGNADSSEQLTLISKLQEEALQNPVAHRPHAHAEPAHAATVPPEAGRQTVTGDATQQATESHPAALTLSAEEQVALDTLRKVRFGTWFSFMTDDEQPARLAKLSWFSRLSGNYMFVDSMGVRAVTCHSHELAGMLVSGKVRILANNQQPFVQRALKTIRRLLGSHEHRQEQPRGTSI